MLRGTESSPAVAQQRRSGSPQAYVVALRSDDVYAYNSIEADGLSVG